MSFLRSGISSEVWWRFDAAPKGGGSVGPPALLLHSSGRAEAHCRTFTVMDPELDTLPERDKQIRQKISICLPCLRTLVVNFISTTRTLQRKTTHLYPSGLGVSLLTPLCSRFSLSKCPSNLSLFARACASLFKEATVLSSRPLVLTSNSLPVASA